LTEALGIVDQIAEAGAREVTLIGGEAYLYPDWLKIARALTDAGVAVTMTTGARRLDAARAHAAAEAGIRAISVSIDGMRETHDKLRAVRGSFDAASAALRFVREAGIRPHANTQWNRLNLPEVEALGAYLLDAGVRVWQVQVTGPMGRAADRPEWLFQPEDMLDLVPRLAAVARKAAPSGMRVEAANNLGYFGPYEADLRRAPWQGCQAGRYVLGIEANGDVKGCPSLPSTPYVGGNLREKRLVEIWETAALRFTRDRDTSELWGFCKTCYYAEDCRGGCSWTAHTLLGKRGNMPWCYHRADTLREAGRRERLVQVERAPGAPFDFGRFHLMEEEIDAWTSADAT
jgi:radical SAM protein with 4Fe4S-binding SPASM domain